MDSEVSAWCPTYPAELGAIQSDLVKGRGGMGSLLHLCLKISLLDLLNRADPLQFFNIVAVLDGL